MGYHYTTQIHNAIRLRNVCETPAKHMLHPVQNVRNVREMCAKPRETSAKRALYKHNSFPPPPALMWAREIINPEDDY